MSMSDVTGTEKKRRLAVLLLGLVIGVSVLVLAFSLFFSPEETGGTATMSPANADRVSGQAGGVGSEEYNQKLREHDQRQAGEALKSGESFVATPVGDRKPLVGKKTETPPAPPPVAPVRVVSVQAPRTDNAMLKRMAEDLATLEGRLAAVSAGQGLIVYPPLEGGKPFNDVVERSDAQAGYMRQIIHRMENLPKDPRIDNPLKITNDARKAGLDYRLIDPDADDFAGSKINAAVERIHAIWRETAADRGTQLVFCDLSTPRGGKAQASAHAARQELESGALIDVDGTLVRETPEQEDVEDDALGIVDMDAIIAASGTFSVYDDMKQNLMAKGIPAGEIAFIHDANTDMRKAKLFSDMNAGRVRILLGSTSKMGAGMNVQKRLVAAHHLDAPWRPSDLEQRNGRIIRQGNMFYERDPDKFSVAIYNYATKQTYDARMWQTIEYKSAAIEQFRKGDLLQRVIDDVQSEAANAAEMKAAASGNPLILMQVRLAADLRKLEALYSQHQRGQHRLRDRLQWLEGADTRLAGAEADHAAHLRCRDTHTQTVRENGREKIRIALHAGDRVLTDKDGEKMKDLLLGCVKEVTRNSGAKALFGSYRGFSMHIVRHTHPLGGKDGFRIVVSSSAGSREFMPDNLVYTFDDRLSLSGLFQRMDNFLGKGLEEGMEKFREKCRQENAELETVREALGREFPQMAELRLARENNSAIVRELQRMRDDAGYISAWVPKTLPKEADTGREEAGQAASASQPQKIVFGEGDGRREYSITNRHNGAEVSGYVVRSTVFHQLVGSLGQSLYEDGQWYTTATAPRGVNLLRFASPEEAVAAAREDAARRGLCSAATAKDGAALLPPPGMARDDLYRQQLREAGFQPAASDFHGKQEQVRTLDAGDGGLFEFRIFQTEEGNIGLRVQYERDRVIDAARSRQSVFETLAEALDQVNAYRQRAAPPAAIPDTVVRGLVFSSPRMR